MPPQASGTSPRRALVVAADSATHRMCRSALEVSGLVVDGVDSGMAAVISAREARPDLIVMDQELRDVSGREVIGWLRSNPALESTPVIVLTTSADDEGAMAGIGPSALLRKPLSPLAIRRAIRTVLA